MYHIECKSDDRSPPRTRRSSASSVGSCAGAIPNQSPVHQGNRTVSGNRSRSPTPHHQVQNKHLGEELRKSLNRSRSPTPQRKHFGSPGHLGGDLNKRRSRSPTPKRNGRSSRSPTPKVDNSRLDPTRKALNEEIRQIKYDGRSQMYHSRNQDSYQVIRGF